MRFRSERQRRNRVGGDVAVRTCAGLIPPAQGLAIAILLATWAEPYAVPDTASVETRLDVIVGLGLPLILILVVVDSLWQRWQGDAPLHAQLRRRQT